MSKGLTQPLKKLFISKAKKQFCVRDHDLLTDFTRVLLSVFGSDVSTEVQELLKLGLALVTTGNKRGFNF